MINCFQCDQPTDNPRFCSRSCAAVYNNKLKPKRARSNSCKSCGCSIRSGFTYCTPCWSGVSEPEDMTLGGAVYSKGHRSSAYALVRSRARSAVRDRPRVCTSCGYDKHVEVCHIKPIRSFSDCTMLSVINSQDNLLLLCPNCHWEFDHQSLALST